MQQNRITERGPLHTPDGILANPGYATSLLMEYTRRNITAGRWRVKEWDYYLINDEEYALALTLGDLGYMGLVSASIIDLVENTYQTESVIVPFPMGGWLLPERSDEGTSYFSNNKVRFKFDVVNGTRKIRAWFSEFYRGEDLHVEAILDEEPQDSMVIATPWAEDPHAFYYNQKIVCMRARGSFRIGYDVHGFRPEDSFGLLDWGRGVWTRDNTWYWAAAQGLYHSKEKYVKPRRIGLNLGYGFGDTSAATENMIFYDGRAYKLGAVDFGIPEREMKSKKLKSAGDKYELMQPWRIKDSEGKLDLVFTPCVDRCDYTNVGLIITDQHQVFGTYSGTAYAGEKKLEIENLRGFAEVVRNKY